MQIVDINGLIHDQVQVQHTVQLRIHVLQGQALGPLAGETENGLLTPGETGYGLLTPGQTGYGLLTPGQTGYGLLTQQQTEYGLLTLGPLEYGPLHGQNLILIWHPQL